jgi:hypothetical protein
MISEGYAYFCWARTQPKAEPGRCQWLLDVWAQITPRNWWWCRGCYDWHWSPLTLEQWRSANTSGEQS